MRENYHLVHLTPESSELAIDSDQKFFQIHDILRLSCSRIHFHRIPLIPEKAVARYLALNSPIILFTCYKIRMASTLSPTSLLEYFWLSKLSDGQ